MNTVRVSELKLPSRAWFVKKLKGDGYKTSLSWVPWDDLFQEYANCIPYDCKRAFFSGVGYSGFEDSGEDRNQLHTWLTVEAETKIVYYVNCVARYENRKIVSKSVYSDEPDEDFQPGVVWHLFGDDGLYYEKVTGIFWYKDHEEASEFQALIKKYPTEDDRRFMMRAIMWALLRSWRKIEYHKMALDLVFEGRENEMLPAVNSVYETFQNEIDYEPYQKEIKGRYYEITEYVAKNYTLPDEQKSEITAKLAIRAFTS